MDSCSPDAPSEALAGRPQLPAAAVARLIEHPASTVRQAAQDNPRLPRLR